MGKIYQNIEELIGRTPLLEVAGIEKELGLLAKILVKLEYLNPPEASRTGRQSL